MNDAKWFLMEDQVAFAVSAAQNTDQIGDVPDSTGYGAGMVARRG